MKTQLKNYTNKLLQLELFKNNNSKLFDDLNQLQEELQKAEIELKEVAKEKGEDIENDVVSVKVIECYTKFFDYNTFEKEATKKEKSALEKSGGIIITKEIDKTIFDGCVKAGLISQEVRQKTYKEEFKNKSIRIINK